MWCSKLACRDEPRLPSSRRGRVLNDYQLVFVQLVKVWCYHDLVFLGPYPNQLQIVLRIVLADLLDSASCLHCKVGDQRCVLHRYIVFKGASDWDAVCVDDDDSKYPFVRADPFQGLLHHGDVPHLEVSC